MLLPRLTAYDSSLRIPGATIIYVESVAGGGASSYSAGACSALFTLYGRVNRILLHVTATDWKGRQSGKLMKNIYFVIYSMRNIQL